MSITKKFTILCILAYLIMSQNHNGYINLPNGILSGNIQGGAGGSHGAWGIGGSVSYQHQVAPNVYVGPHASGGYGGNKYGSGGGVNSFGLGATFRF